MSPTASAIKYVGIGISISKVYFPSGFFSVGFLALITAIIPLGVSISALYVILLAGTSWQGSKERACMLSH